MPQDDQAVFRQIEYLGNELTKMEAAMIDPVDYGQLKGAVAALQNDMRQMQHDMQVMGQKLDLVLDKLAEAKGGWRVMMLIGGAAAGAGGIVSWAVNHLRLQ